jgi:hypothetical protein
MKKKTGSEWLTKQEAAEQLGLGVRRTLDLAHNGALKTERVRDPLTHQWTVRFHARDIERYLELRRTPAEARSQLERVRATVEDGLRPSPEAAAALEPVPALPHPEAAPAISPATWLTLAEAAGIAGGLAALDLLDMIQAGHLPAWLARGTREKHGLIDRYRVKRTDLETLAGVRVERSAEKTHTVGAA